MTAKPGCGVQRQWPKQRQRLPAESQSEPIAENELVGFDRRSVPSEVLNGDHHYDACPKK